MITITNNSQQSNIRFEIALKELSVLPVTKGPVVSVHTAKAQICPASVISKELDMINIQCPQEWNHPVVLWVHLIQEFLKHYHVIMYFF